MKNLFNSFIEFLRRSKKTVLLITIVAAATLILSAMISIWISKIDNYYFPSFGTIHTTGVKAFDGNITLKEEKQYIDWGTIYPGTSTNRSFSIQSKSNIDTTLKLETANWTFFDSDDNNVTEFVANNMTVTWDYNETIVHPNETIYVTLTLKAGSSPDFINNLIINEVQKFSFDIHIYASEGS
ncbi:MAG: hypothetical protein U9O89_07020 [Thermoproteota archaeon]|nr:hypothetical protein [Thermoproteota archaeon]